MGSNKILGLIFANTFEDGLPELTASRTMGSVPFGGKYRLIDFPLSNMSNSGINNVGVITKSNFLSLMDHLGTGNAWDLAKRRSGLTILPPYKEHSFDGIVETIYTLHAFIEHGTEEYVLVDHAGCVSNFNYRELLEFHEQKGADITFLYSRNSEFCETKTEGTALEIDENDRVTKALLPTYDSDTTSVSGAFLIKKDLLMSMVRNLVAENKTDFTRDFLQPNVDKLKIYAYENTGYCAIITSIKDYYRASMELMKPEVRADLFNPKHPIYTKVRDDMPSRYGLESSVKGSLIAQGCTIDGMVENSIISKGVRIGKGAHIKNCIIMQDTIIGENADLSHIIIDKDVTVGDSKTIIGCESYPMYIPKRSVI